MKLRGINSKKLSKEDRKKKEETLKRMEETRKKDSAYLRDIIQAKYEWAIAERIRGLKEKEKLNAQILRLEGIILFCKDILVEKAKKKEKK